MNEWIIDEQDADLVADLIDSEIRNCITVGDCDPEYLEKLEKVRFALDNADTILIIRPLDDDGYPVTGNVIQFPAHDEIIGDYAA